MQQRAPIIAFGNRQTRSLVIMRGAIGGPAVAGLYRITTTLLQRRYDLLYRSHKPSEKLGE
jgi:hypothetical protein